MVRLKPILFVICALLLAWMHYWANDYVTQSDLLTRAQNEFSLAASWKGNDADFSMAVGKDRVETVARARQEWVKQMPPVAHARMMLITVSAWMTGALALLTLITYSTECRERRVRRSLEA